MCIRDSLVEAYTAQGGDDFAHRVFAVADAELFSERDAHGGCYLHGDARLFFVERLPDFRAVVPDNDRAGRADGGALAAADADAFADGLEISDTWEAFRAEFPVT